MLLFVCAGDRVIIVIIVLLLGGGVVVVVIAIFLIVDTQVCSFGGFLTFPYYFRHISLSVPSPSQKLTYHRSFSSITVFISKQICVLAHI